MKWFKDVVTDNSGDADIVSLAALIAFLVFFGLSIYQVVWRDKDFDMQGYGIAVAGLLAATGAGYHLKANKEPPKE